MPRLGSSVRIASPAPVSFQGIKRLRKRPDIDPAFSFSGQHRGIAPLLCGSLLPRIQLLLRRRCQLHLGANLMCRMVASPRDIHEDLGRITLCLSEFHRSKAYPPGLIDRTRNIFRTTRARSAFEGLAIVIVRPIYSRAVRCGAVPTLPAILIGHSVDMEMPAAHLALGNRRRSWPDPVRQISHRKAVAVF